MNQTNGKARRAVLVSAVPGTNTVRICLDDVVSEFQAPKSWFQREHVTNKEISLSSFENGQFDDKELADFGFFILARLSAFMDRGEL